MGQVVDHDLIGGQRRRCGEADHQARGVGLEFRRIDTEIGTGVLRIFGELEEVEEELLHPKKDEESQQNSHDTSMVKKGFKEIVMQSFMLTFLAEWGE